MLYTAKHRFADMGPRKMRPFAHLIYGKNVDEAVEALRFYPNRGARLIEAVLKSAYGNAEDRGCENLEDLVVHEIKIDGGPMFKRIQPRARGTAFGILRRLSHITVVLADPVAAVGAATPTTATTTPAVAAQ
jgi:large subunit ribosomal protein L22